MNVALIEILKSKIFLVHIGVVENNTLPFDIKKSLLFI
jgi:hypothetical protein